MSTKAKCPYVSQRYIRLSEQEDQIVREKASTAGMSVSSFIKRAALSKTIKVFDIPILSQHIVSIGGIAHDIHVAISLPHQDRWLYQADLERIEDKLDQLLAIETDIQTSLRKNMR